MSSDKLPSLDERLRKAGIRHFDELIHDQKKKWLVRRFGHRARKYPVNVSMLMRNIIWQARERIQRGDKEPLTELIRTFWYMYIKPTLARAGALGKEVDQYKQLSAQLVYMVKKIRVMQYEDIGFRDDNEFHRRVGPNASIILFSEKLGHQSFLSEVAAKYRVSILALGGQPSVLNIEYFVRELRKARVNLKRSFYLFGIVDYDPSGWIIRDAFVDDLNLYGIKNVRMYDLITPDMLTPEEITMARYPIPQKKSMTVKNNAWLEEVRTRNYRNQRFLKDTKGDIIYGLEAEAVSGKRIAEKLEEVMVPLVGKSENLVIAYELKKLNKAIRSLILHKMTGSI